MNFEHFQMSHHALIITSATYTLEMNWSESERALHKDKQRSTVPKMLSKILKKAKNAKDPAHKVDSLHTCVRKVPTSFRLT